DGGTALQLLEGRYGPYVTDGEVNASLPKGSDPSALSLDEARALLEARRSAAPSPRRAKRGSTGASRGRGRTAARVGDAAPLPKAKAKAKAKAGAAAKPAAGAAKRPVRKRAS